MRVLSGWFVLFALFALAGVVHRGWTRELHRERIELRTGEGSGPPSGRARVVIGRPAGTEPLASWPAPIARAEQGNAPAPARADRGAGAGPLIESAFDEPGGAPLAAQPILPPWTPVFEVTVRPGQVLSQICEDFYGTGRPPLPALVARYNGLTDEHSLRAGQSLELPPKEQLEP
ncbi:MAG: hypothetical protein CMJ84_05385 [Planctomycetes bacterium]|nr:hypothetical protein [Planctomycetota bacterium]MDP6408654.1 LysM domain-containing protein [Planctomycetota bacterium]